MAKPFDATIKHLVELHPVDWLKLAGFPSEGAVEVIDADLSSVSAAADKIIRVTEPSPFVAHMEFQAGPDKNIDERVLFYSILVRHRHKLPVRSVLFLLRPEAERYATGKILDSGADDEYLEFRYRRIRVWEQPVEVLLKGGTGTLPLAPISNLGAMPLSDVCHQLTERIDRENPEELKEVVTATMILLGLNHPNEMIRHLFRGVRHMKESSVYQAIVEEGMEIGLTKGRVEEAKSVLIRLGERRFGVLPPDVEAVLRPISDLTALETLIDRIQEASSWRDLLPPTK